MINIKSLKLKCFILSSVLIFASASIFATTNQNLQKPSELPRDDVFPPADNKLLPLQGNIANGRYHAPSNIFSCQAYDFGEGGYTAQDGLLEQAACVGFYSATADFKKAEVFLFPGLENQSLNKEALKNAFEHFGIGILKKVDNAQGIEILEDAMVGDNMFFTAISIEKMSVLQTPNGEYLASTRGYLVFQDKDKLVVLSNQKITLPNQKHDPKKHIEHLKQDILEFRKTFEFGAIPTCMLEKIKADRALLESEPLPTCPANKAS